MLQDSAAFSGFSVDDIEIAKKFYGETLGLSIDESAPAGIGLNFTSGHKVFIYPKGDAHQAASFTVLNFPVVDIDAAVAELTQKGITFENYNNPQMPQDDQAILRGKSVNMGPDIAWFKDPAGNILALLED